MPILSQQNMLKQRRHPVNDRNHCISIRNGQSSARTKIILHIHNNKRIPTCGSTRDLHKRLSPAPGSQNLVLQLDWTNRMPASHRILPALLLCCTALAQTANPAPAAKPAQNSNTQSQNATPEYTDPCAANAMQVDFDTCYADQFKLTDQDLNHLYRNTLLAFEADIADAQKHSNQSQLSYDATAIGDLKAAQAEWVKYRDLHCRAAGQQLQGGSIQPIVVNKCMILVTRHRIDDIRAAYEIGGRNLE
jgi:uncharacterized protein YecT (DUF1311 family)